MIRNLPLTIVTPNPNQPRKTFDAQKIRELAASIEREGLIQPITVRKVGEGYMIVAGERRYRAHMLLAEEGRLPEGKITARVSSMSEEQMDVQAIIENLQREDVPPLEEAAAFQRLVDRGMTIEEISERCGVAAFRVRWRLQLDGLSDEVKHLLATGQIDKQVALEVSRLPSQSEQMKVVRLVNRGALIGWKAVRTAVDDLINPPAETASMFGEDAPAPSADEQNTASKMAQKVERAAACLGGGWKDGECVIATKVNPGEAERIADQLKAMQAMIRTMERQLRNTVAKAHVAAA